MVLSGVVVAGVLHRQRVARCAGGAAKLAGVWDEARRAEVRRAFAASGAPYAAVALASVERSFDAYARAFVAGHTDACEATRVRGEQSAELLDLRMSCLQDRLTAWKTLSQLFASADAAVVARAPAAAQSLPALATCADAVALRAPIPPPRDAATAKTVEAIRAGLARAGALELAARYDDGLALARAALAAADPIGYAPVKAEAELRVGRLTGAKGDYAESARILERAYVDALAGRHEEAAARAATDWSSPPARARPATPTAIAGPRSPPRSPAACSARTSCSASSTRRARTCASARASTPTRSPTPTARSPSRSASSAPSTSPWPRPGTTSAPSTTFAPSTKALDAYRHCLSIEEKLAGPDNPVLLGARVGMADVYGDSGDHERALAGYQSALGCSSRARPNDPDVPMIRNNMGGELQQLDRPKEAIAQYRLALADWQERIGPGKEVVTALSNIGEAELALGEDRRRRSPPTTRACRCAKALGEDHPLCARLIGWRGECLRRLGRLGEAQASFARALALGERALGPKHPQLVQALFGLGRVALARGNPAAAEPPLRRALAILGDEPGEGSTAPDLRFTLATAEWASGERAQARAHMTAARERYAIAGAPGKRGFAEANAWLAKHR